MILQVTLDGDVMPIDDDLDGLFWVVPLGLW